MGRSNSRSHSSRSKSRSPSSSRSRSHSRKKRYSSRSRSRTYSRSRSRERVYNRDFRRDYRNNRGMRRPYGFRARTRGYYQGGGGRYYRGGYRPMWNRRYSRSPRRGRSRSRSPKRRSASSQRSRSRSQKSYKSSQSPRSSSSRSSSGYSKSPVKKSRVSQEKTKQKTEEAEKLLSPSNEKSGDEHKDAFDPSEPIDELGKEMDLHGESWAGLSAYDNSPRSPCSPSPVASPPSSSQSDCPILSVVHSGKDTLSQNSHSIVHSPERSASGSGGNGSTRYSPSQNSPIHIPSQKSPAKTAPSQNPSREEGRSHYSLYTDTVEQELAKGAKLLKRYTDEDLSLFPVERANIREKEGQKDRPLDKAKKEGERTWDIASDSLDYFLEKDPIKTQFLSISESEDLEEAEDYRQFRKSVLANQGKGFSSTSNFLTEEEGTKHKSKAVAKGVKEGEKVREGKGQKVSSKDRRKDDDKGADRDMLKKEAKSPDQVIFEKTSDPFSCSFPLHHSFEVREKAVFREESPLRIKMFATESHHPEVKLRMIDVPLDDTRPSSMTSDRLLASTLVHSVKRQKDFRSIFDHMKVSFSSKTSPESFIYHVVSLVQFVKEHYFKGDGQTLSERFARYQTVAKEQSSRPKSPEIHRRIDLSLNIQRKQIYLQKEDKDMVVKEEPTKVEKKLKSSLIDLRGESDSRRKERSKERGDSKCSRESSDSRKREKTQKEQKELKFFKDDNKRRKDHEPSPPPSDEDKDIKKESRDEEFKGPLDPKEYTGFPGITRPRGTFQFRIRGRGRARGVFAGTSTAPVNTAPTFQKRSKEEEWDPEYTPKSKKYFLHDDRDDGVDYWARRARGRGNFQRGRGRFPFKKSGSSPKWTHDKYQGDGLVDDEEEGMEDRRKDEKE